jgi:hypothetical protein
MAKKKAAGGDYTIGDQTFRHGGLQRKPARSGQPTTTFESGQFVFTYPDGTVTRSGGYSGELATAAVLYLRHVHDGVVPTREQLAQLVDATQRLRRAGVSGLDVALLRQLVEGGR